MLIVLVLYIFIQQFENHLFYPLVVKKIVGIPALFVIIALIIGAKLAGFLGILLAVPAAAVIMEILNDIEKNKAARQIKK
jgi:predicted PurR-regulated permease PerM